MPVGQDPIAGELKSAYGTDDIYGMHWLEDVDNVYGYGDTPGGGCELGPTATGPSYINTFQRGAQESVWETVPQPTCDAFKYGGKNGYLDLFTGDSSYAQQWKYTDAPDADARAIQAAYWADTWAQAQGKEADVKATVAKAGEMGDYLRYSFFDKYFKKIGNCTNASTCAAGTGKDSEHYLLSWYYAWGGSEGSGGGWAWRIGDGAAHFGYQNPLAAYALTTDPNMAPKSATGKQDWTTSLGRQLEFYQWLQSSEGAIAGGATNSWDGSYSQPPAGTPTFYGMAYDWEPVYHDPPSNQWFGMQAWSMERVAEYYQQTGDARAKSILDKWVAWAMSQTTVNADGTFKIPSDLQWSGAPDTWNASSPGANTGLHVTVSAYGDDLGVTAAFAKTLSYYAAKSGNTAAKTMAKAAARRHVEQLPGPAGHRHARDPRGLLAVQRPGVRPVRLDRHDAERRQDRLQLHLPGAAVLLQERPQLVQGRQPTSAAARPRPSPTTASGPRRTSRWRWGRTACSSTSDRPEQVTGPGDGAGGR